MSRVKPADQQTSAGPAGAPGKPPECEPHWHGGNGASFSPIRGNRMDLAGRMEKGLEGCGTATKEWQPNRSQAAPFSAALFPGAFLRADRQTGRGSPAGHVGQFDVGGKEAEKILYEGQLMLYDTDEQGRLVWFSLLVCMWEMNVVRMYRGGKTFDSGKAGEWERQIIKIKIILMM